MLDHSKHCIDVGHGQVVDSDLEYRWIWPLERFDTFHIEALGCKNLGEIVCVYHGVLPACRQAGVPRTSPLSFQGEPACAKPLRRRQVGGEIL